MADLPWQRLRPAPKKGGHRPIPQRSDLAWRAMASTYITEVAAMEESHRKQGGKRKGKNTEEGE